MYVKKYLGISIFAVAAVTGGTAWSQVTTEKLLGAVVVSGPATCSTIDIQFNRPVSVTSSTPQFTGTDLAVRLEPLATTLPSADQQSFKEAASVAPSNSANLSAVVFDPAASAGPVVHVLFNKAMSFKIIADTDSRHLQINVADAKNSEKCVGKQAAAELPPLKSSLTDKADEPMPANTAAGALKEGKKFLNAGDFARSTAFFTKAVTTGSGVIKQEAQEMLGLSRERAGQMAFARSEYETYLKLYPGGANAARVRDRLGGIVAALENSATKQFTLRQSQKLADAPVSNTDGKGNKTVQALAPSVPSTGQALQVTAGGIKTNLRDTPPDPKKWVWEKHGSFAQYYYRDDNFVASVPGGKSLDLHRVYQNEALASADFYLRGENDAYSFETNVSAYNEKGFGEQSDINLTNLSTIYIDGRMKQEKLGARLGRQSKSTGGVFGRFDGAVLTYEPVTDLKLQTVAGSPVYSSKALPFADGRYFYGASLDYTLPSKEWAGGIYAIEQDIHDIVDRRAIGADLRYLGKQLTVYSSADFDIFYQELNNAYVSGTWNPQEGTSLYATADFRRVPFLLTSNALIGQNFSKLTSLVDAVGQDDANAWATDRTAYSETLTVGGSYQLLADWQIALDATIAKYSGTPASGGVDATPDPGIEYYLGAQLSGSSIFKENDSVSFGLRYSASQTAKTYMADAGLRYPVNDKLRIGPRLRLSYTDSKTDTFLVIPSINARYRFDKKWSLESEIGARWQERLDPINPSSTLDVLGSVGFRFEF
jgi:Autotransporter beta-domain